MNKLFSVSRWRPLECIHVYSGFQIDINRNKTEVLRIDKNIEQIEYYFNLMNYRLIIVVTILTKQLISMLKFYLCYFISLSAICFFTDPIILVLVLVFLSRENRHLYFPTFNSNQFRGWIMNEWIILLQNSFFSSFFNTLLCSYTSINSEFFLIVISLKLFKLHGDSVNHAITTHKNKLDRAKFQ